VLTCSILGERLNVVGLVDRDHSRSERVLAIKRKSQRGSYDETVIFASVQEAGAALAKTMIHLVIDGLPPIARGSTQPGHDNELQLLKLFPDAVFFIEKPISGAVITEVLKVREALAGRVVSVGYMLRYLKAVQYIKRTIAEHGLTVMLTTAIYLLAYSYAGEVDKNQTLAFWDKTRERGPIVSQGTHLVDLTRYLSSEPIMDSLRVHTVEHSDPAGHLSQLKMNEDDLIAPIKQIPRVTNAIWRTQGGGTASFIHGICLHEGDYDCEVNVLADGWKFTLREPYSASPYLMVRRPGGHREERIDFNEDDCYNSEFSTLIDILDGKTGPDAILSSYADALETYKLTCEITTVGEQAFKDRTD